MADTVEALPPPEYGGESGRSSPSPASPEFEFWTVGKNPSPALLTADELFYGGIMLPLHTLQASPTDGDGDGAVGTGPDSTDAPAVPAEAEEAEAAQPLSESGIAPTPDLPAVTFKWKDIFKANGGGGGEPKERKKTERRVSSVSGNAELININIWPFSRSRSAGSSSRAKQTPSANGAANNASAPASAPAPAARKVSSAPCSRSNSRGESGHEPAALPAAAAVEVEVEAAAGGQAAPLPGPTSLLRRLVAPELPHRAGAAHPDACAKQKQASAKRKAAAAAPVPAMSDDNNPAAPP